MISPIAHFNGEEAIPLETVIAWMHSPDLRVRAEVFRLTEVAWSRIQPEPSAEEQCSFMADYLVECLIRNIPDDDYIHSGFEAAWGLAAWVKHLAGIPEGKVYIPRVVGAVEAAFAAGGTELRDRIHTGLVEHALESRAVRPYFSHWAQSASALAEVHAQALEWADAHLSDT